MKKSKKYELTRDEINLILSMPGIRLADYSTAYDIIEQKISKLKESGIYINPERIPIILEEAKKLIKNKGAVGRGRFTYFTSSKRLY